MPTVTDVDLVNEAVRRLSPAPLHEAESIRCIKPTLPLNVAAIKQLLHALREARI
jgi:hypothetical protein